VTDPIRRVPHLISVIVPMVNNADTIAAQLEGLAQQGYRGAWEAIVADNGSEDRSVEIATVWLSRLPAGRLVSSASPRSAGHARNTGAAAAAGDFLAFTDADDIPAPNWLQVMAHAAPHADLVAGEVTIDELSDEVTRYWHVVSPRQRALASFRFLVHASGTNTGIWTEVFRDVGGFDESMNAGEDIEFSWRAQLAGYRLMFAEQAIVHERVRERIGPLIRQHFLYGAAGPDLYRRFAHAGMPPARASEVARAWARVTLLAVLAPWSRRFRGRWALELGLANGRVAGVVRGWKPIASD
jgi:glycosyltransferase involved in cell wall biosynthesis